jgi:uncharacterized protein
MLGPEKFIKDTKEILDEPKMSQEQVDNGFEEKYGYPLNKQKVNVLYMNTACNLRCDYCYETEKRSDLKKQETVTQDQYIQFFDEIANREKGVISTVVIMGGEIFLNYALLLEILRYVSQKLHNYAISITTNGTLLHKWSKQQLEHIRKRIVTFEVSWDGSGQDRRQYADGHSSRKRVRKNLEYLRSIGIDYKISYTVHRDNYQKMLYDMVYILEKLKPNAIKLSFACQELSDMGVDFVSLKNNFIEYAEQLFLSYHIPICDLSCTLCGKCDFSNFDGNHYMSPTKGEIFKDSHTKEQFNSF